MHYPIQIDDEGVIQNRPLWSGLNWSQFNSLYNSLMNVPLRITRIWMNEDDYKDIVDYEVTCNNDQ